MKAQMKIQQTAFMLIAVTLFFVFVGLFVLGFKFSGLKQAATDLNEKNAMLLVSKLANSPEFSCGESYGGKRINCVDADKVMMLKQNINKYENFWGVSDIKIRKIYPGIETGMYPGIETGTNNCEQSLGNPEEFLNLNYDFKLTVGTVLWDDISRYPIYGTIHSCESGKYKIMFEDGTDRDFDDVTLLIDKNHGDIVIEKSVDENTSNTNRVKVDFSFSSYSKVTVQGTGRVETEYEGEDIENIILWDDIRDPPESLTLKVYHIQNPAFGEQSGEVPCTMSNYPECNLINIIKEDVVGTYYSTFVALCRKEAKEGYFYDKCELAKLMVSFEKIG